LCISAFKKKKQKKKKKEMENVLTINENVWSSNKDQDFLFAKGPGNPMQSYSGPAMR
jgi:hypothetical protein